MPLADAQLSKLMLSQLQSQLKSKYPESNPTPFQEEITSAISKGTVKALKTLAVAPALIPSPVVAGPGVGITVDDKLMVSACKAAMIGQVGQVGEAFELMAKVIMKAVADHLKLATVTSVSGFGGQAGPIQNITEASLTPLIVSSFPPKTVANLQTSQYGLGFIKALSSGIAAGVSAGQAGIVPFATAPPPPGLLIAKFS